jgi:IS30 family transposase
MNARVYPDGRRVDYSTGHTTMVSVTDSLSSLIPEVIGSRLLSLTERESIADLNRAGWSLRAIGRELGRPASTIKRELDAHTVNGRYLPHAAHRAAASARTRPKPAKLAQPGRLREYVSAKLSEQWSPEQIRNRIRADHPDDEDMRVSTEIIYQALYVQARGGLKREVADALRTGRARRKPRRSPDQRTSRFVEPMVMISERPAEVEDRAVPGHWEGDLITGALNQSAIITLVELIGTLPEHLRGSLTWDQGAEMAAHKSFKIATGVPVYFCDPASPWQRGSNENTNGLLHQYFPKGTDLSVYGTEDLELVAQKLNGRPRKTLGWKTPAERLLELV